MVRINRQTFNEKVSQIKIIGAEQFSTKKSRKNKAATLKFDESSTRKKFSDIIQRTTDALSGRY